MNDHERREIIVFEEFASVCPLSIQSGSVKKRQPPEPDLLCNTKRGPLAFELVELVDGDRVARMIGDQLSLMDIMRDARNILPDETRIAFANAWIGVKFRPQSLRRRKMIAEAVVRRLTVMDPTFEGEFRLNDREFEGAVADVQRGDRIVDGPHFRVLNAGHFDPVPLDAMRDKFGKEYQSGAPVELLAYYDRQQAPPEEQLDALVQFIHENISNSPFGRIWIFNRFDRRIYYPK